jgi:hypothetical protein
MSFTYSYLAAKCEVHVFREALLAAWPSLELDEPAQQFASWESAYQWAVPRCGYLQGAHPNDVKLLFRDGAWSVVADISLCMSSDGDSLAELSRRVGRVVVATTQGTAGFAQLLVFEAGAAIRSITAEAGHTVETGTPLPEEVGIPLETFYLDELDSIWQRMGLSSFLSAEPAGPVMALQVLDRTPYPEIAAAGASASRPTDARRQPWWKFW